MRGLSDAHQAVAGSTHEPRRDSRPLTACAGRRPASWYACPAPAWLFVEQERKLIGDVTNAMIGRPPLRHSGSAPIPTHPPADDPRNRLVTTNPVPMHLPLQQATGVGEQPEEDSVSASVAALAPALQAKPLAEAGTFLATGARGVPPHAS